MARLFIIEYKQRHKRHWMHSNDANGAFKNPWFALEKAAELQKIAGAPWHYRVTEYHSVKEFGRPAK